MSSPSGPRTPRVRKPAKRFGSPAEPTPKRMKKMATLKSLERGKQTSGKKLKTKRAIPVVPASDVIDLSRDTTPPFQPGEVIVIDGDSDTETIIPRLPNRAASVLSISDDDEPLPHKPCKSPTRNEARRDDEAVRSADDKNETLVDDYTAKHKELSPLFPDLDQDMPTLTHWEDEDVPTHPATASTPTDPGVAVHTTSQFTPSTSTTLHAPSVDFDSEDRRDFLRNLLADDVSEEESDHLEKSAACTTTPAPTSDATSQVGKSFYYCAKSVPFDNMELVYPDTEDSDTD